MNEVPGHSKDSFESTTTTREDMGLNRALEVFQEVFESGYRDFFHNMDPEMRKRLGIRVFSSLDYIYPSASNPPTPTNNETRPLAAPVKLIAGRFELIIEGDRDMEYPPLVTREPETQLPAISNGKYSPKIGILLNRPLYLIRKLFVLTPDGAIQRGVEQITASMTKDTPPIGEVWLGRKWLNLPSSPEASRTEAHELALIA